MTAERTEQITFTEYELGELTKKGMTPDQVSSLQREIAENIQAGLGCIATSHNVGRSLMGEPPSVATLMKENILRTRFSIKSRSDLVMDGFFRRYGNR